MADRIILINGVPVNISYLRTGAGNVITTPRGDIIVLYGSTINKRGTSATEARHHTCQCSCVDGHRTVRLRFLRKQLLYDIKNYAFIESDMLGDPSKHDDNKALHAQHLTADIGETGNIDRVNRKLMMSYMDLVEELYPYTKSEAIEEEIDDQITEPDEYVVELTIPTTMSRTTVVRLSSHIHEYLVYSVVADWLSITNPSASTKWEEKAEAAKTEIARAKILQRKSLTRKLSPF